MKGAGLIMGYVFLITGIGLTFNPIDVVLQVFGTLIMGVGGFMAFATYGVQIDPTNKRFREYGALLGIRYGKWRKQELFPYVSLFASRKVYLGRSYSGVTTSGHVYSTDVCFLTKDHRTKVVLKELPNSQIAYDFAQELVQMTGVRLVKYSPEISEKTLARRRR